MNVCKNHMLMHFCLDEWTVWQPSCYLHGSKTFDESAKVCQRFGVFWVVFVFFAYRCISLTSQIDLLEYHRSPFPNAHTKAVLGSVKSIHSKFVKWIIGGLGHKCSTHVPNFFWVGAWKNWPEQIGLKCNGNHSCMFFSCTQVLASGHEEHMRLTLSEPDLYLALFSLFTLTFGDGSYTVIHPPAVRKSTSFAGAETLKDYPLRRKARD